MGGWVSGSKFSENQKVLMVLLDHTILPILINVGRKYAFFAVVLSFL